MNVPLEVMSCSITSPEKLKQAATNRLPGIYLDIENKYQLNTILTWFMSGLTL